MSDQGQPDPTRRVEPDATQRIDPVDGSGGLAGGEREPWEGTADPHTAGTGTAAGAQGEPGTDPAADEPPKRPGRDAAFGIGGLVLGFLIAVVVIALGTSDRGLDGDVASAERIDALEADLDEREARIAALEARIADAEAGAGQSDADIEAQRQALDERSQALDERVERIDERSQALDRREQELDEREAAIADRERGADADDDGGFLPDIDTEQVETFFDRMLERIRDLF